MPTLLNRDLKGGQSRNNSMYTDQNSVSSSSLTDLPLGLVSKSVCVGSKFKTSESRTELIMSSTARDGEKKTSPNEMNTALLAIANDKDRSAFKSIYSYFSPRLKAFFLSQGTDRQLAEEIVQETMINIWRKAPQFNPQKASAATWIYTIARNRRVDMLRKINRPSPDFNDPAFVVDPQLDSSALVNKEQESRHLNKLITRLSEEQQAVLKLAFFQDKTHGDVAIELDIPLGTVKSRIRLALKRLRKEIRRNYEN